MNRSRIVLMKLGYIESDLFDSRQRVKEWVETTADWLSNGIVRVSTKVCLMHRIHDHSDWLVSLIIVSRNVV